MLVLVRFFRFEKPISDSLSCGCVRTEVIPAACAVCDELVEKFLFLTAAAFALLVDILAHAMHLEAAMRMTAECLEKSPKKQ